MEYLERMNQMLLPGEQIYDKTGNKLGGTYKKVESGVQNEEIYDKLRNRLDGTYIKVKPDSGLPGIEIYDRNGKKLDGENRKLESIKNENENKNKNNMTTFELKSNIEIISANNNDINKLIKIMQNYI